MFGDAYLITATYPEVNKCVTFFPEEDDWYDHYNNKVPDKHDDF